MVCSAFVLWKFAEAVCIASNSSLFKVQIVSYKRVKCYIVYFEEFKFSFGWNYSCNVQTLVQIICMYFMNIFLSYNGNRCLIFDYFFRQRMLYVWFYHFVSFVLILQFVILRASNYSLQWRMNILYTILNRLFTRKYEIVWKSQKLI